MKMLSLLTIVACHGAVLAQTHVTAPPGFLTKSGYGRSYSSIGAYANGRSQLADGTHRGKAMTLKGISFRLYSPSNGYANPGRAFQNVRLQVAETTIARMTTTFSANVATTPTKVYDKALTLPTVWGRHVSVPAPWSIHFPFAASAIYSGTRDLLADFHFTGGKLTNGASWTTRPSAYQLDAARDGKSSVRALVGTMGNAGRSGCVDSGSLYSTVAGRAQMQVRVFHPGDPFEPLAGKLHIEQFGTGFGPNQPTTIAFGFQPNAHGVPFPGVTCNSIHVGLSTPMVWSRQRADWRGSVPPHYPVTGAKGVPHLAAWTNVAIVVQGMWNDSKTGRPMLSAAAQTKVPSMPTMFALAAVHGPTHVSGLGSASPDHNPIRRYTK